MYITTQQIAKQLTADEKNIPEIVQSLMVVKSLVAKRGMNIFNDDVCQKISGKEKNIGQMITFLSHIGRKSLTEIKSLLAVIKQESTYYAKTFVIKAPKDTLSTLHGSLDTSFVDNDSDEQVSDTGVSIKGEGRSYERDFEKDIKKLLR